MAKNKTTTKKAVKKKDAKKTAKKKTAAKQKPVKKETTTGRLSAKLEKSIENDFQAYEELLQTGAGRNEWIEKNCKRMASWQKAAEADDARGQLLYGLCFYYGCGAKEDHKKAVKWFTKCAEQGNAMGQYRLAACCLWGTGIRTNRKRGLALVQKLVGLGMPMAECLLSDCYVHGWGVAKDLKKAQKICYDLIGTGHYDDVLQFSILVMDKDDAWNYASHELAQRMRDTNRYVAITLDAINTLVNSENVFELKLNGLVHIPDDLANALSKFEGTLYLNGLNKLSDNLAKKLIQKTTGNLSLNGIDTLSDSAAGYLSEFPGRLCLRGLKKLSQSAARSLAKKTASIRRLLSCVHKK